MKKVSVFLSVLAVIVFSSSLCFGFEAGSLAFSLSGSASSVVSDSVTESALSINTSIGYFLSNSFEVGIEGSFLLQHGQDFECDYFLSIKNYLAFEEDNYFVPYYGLKLGGTLTGEISPTIIDIHSGMKILTQNKEASLNPEIYFQREFYSSMNRSNFGLRVGVSIYY
jgi:hypothetical protein